MDYQSRESRGRVIASDAELRRESKEAPWGPSSFLYQDNHQGACQMLHAGLKTAQFVKRGKLCKMWLGRAIRACRRGQFVSMLEADRLAWRNCGKK